MMVRPSEFGMIQQMDNVSQVKQYENSRPMAEQQTLVQQMQKDTETKLEQIRHKDNADNEKKKFDAKDKSGNEYAGGQPDNKKRRKNDGTFFIKGQGVTDFDIKI